MKTITIRNQAEMDNLPQSFDEFTKIEIRADEAISVKYHRGNSQVTAYGDSQVTARGGSQVTAYGSSRVTAYGDSQVTACYNSRVTAYENSRVTAYENSLVTAWDYSRVIAWDYSQVTAWDIATIRAHGKTKIKCYEFSTAYILNSSVTIEELFDKSTLKCCIPFDEESVLKRHDTAQIITIPDELSFETYIERGFIKADGLMHRIVSKKKINDVEVFEADDGFVVKKGALFSHGETIEKAISDLKYKISDRDMTKFESWRVDDIKKTDELIEAYRVITGACEFGVKDFCNGRDLKEKYKIAEVIEMTKDSFGGDKFREFFKGE